MADYAELLALLDGCPRGTEGWRQYEDVAAEILRFAFAPPLEAPLIQARSFSGIDRRDAIFPNRNFGNDNYWGQLQGELDARMVLVEFKNYDHQELGADEVDQTRNYMTKTIGRFAMICCRSRPSDQALLRRNQVFTQEQKVIIFMTDSELKEVLYMRERGDDPGRLIMELVELFYVQHE